MTIYSVEIPHQRTPICWVADDEASYIARTAEAFMSGDGLPEDATFADAQALNGSDLSQLLTFMSTDEAAAAAVDGWGGHQSDRAEAELLKQVRKHSDEITDVVLRARLCDVDLVIWVGIGDSVATLMTEDGDLISIAQLAEPFLGEEDTDLDILTDAFAADGWTLTNAGQNLGGGTGLNDQEFIALNVYTDNE